MSYEPTVWKTGDVVTSEKLNKLENGVANAGGAMIVTATVTMQGDIILNSTFKEIAMAFSITPVFVTWATDAASNFYPVTGLTGTETQFTVKTIDNTDFSTDTIEGYPKYTGLG